MPIALSFFAVFSVYGVTSPYLPVLVRGLGYGAGLVGILLGLFELAGIAGPFLFGRLADRLGRYKPSLFFALALVAGSAIPLSLVHNPYISALSIIILAAGLRSLIPLMDATATITLGSTGNYGLVRAAGSVSFVLVALGLQYVSFMRPDKPLNIGVWLVITAIASMVALIFLPDSRPRSRSAQCQDPAERGNGKRKIMDAGLLAGFVVIALGRLAMAPIVSFFSLFLVEEIQWDAVGLMWAISASSEIPFMVFSSRLIRRFGAPRLLAASVVAVAARLAVYALFPNPAGAVSGQLLHSLCFGLFHPAAVAFVSARVPPERRATGMALYLAFCIGIPTFVGSAISGLVVELAGYRVLFASFIVFALASTVLYLFTHKLMEDPARPR
jgi:PPP family 3-phenylpropionic acid transporter